MKEMTTHERMTRMFEHRDADRVPITDYPWEATMERWKQEGMPKDADFASYFDLDKFAGVGGDNSPRYEGKVLEETDEYIIYTSGWGVTLKSWKHKASVPEFLDYKVNTPEAWAEAKAQMQPTPDRIDWSFIKANYKRWRDEGQWINGGLWFGFDVTHSWMAGTETILTGMIEDPEWISDMFNHYLDVSIALLEMIWQEGYTFDAVAWPDDMGYKLNQFFSLRTYRAVLKPVQKRACDWAHSKGIKTMLHSCGDIRPFIPELIEIGIDSLNPLEVKAGNNPVEIKRQYGDKLVLQGGLNAVLWDKPDQIEAEMRSVVPILKQNGGYILSSDHSIPSSVSLKDFKRIIELMKELGSYD
ncbi:MAG: uroporphyrinogen decarboxylase family protein [bacterium]|jgi:uroporphyrinogen decarboxylase